MQDTVVPIVIMTLLVGGPITAWIVSRVLAHNEYMAMLRMGIVPPPDSRAARRAARAGWVPPPNTFGTAGQPGMQDPYASYGGYVNYYAQRQLHRGISVALIGLALLIAMGMIGHGGFTFGRQLLPGLVVTFVGLAQIINGVLGGARVGGGVPYQQQQQQSGSQSPFGQQQPGNGNFGPPPSAPTGGSPYGWRPGNVPEIEKPAQPPDQR